METSTIKATNNSPPITAPAIQAKSELAGGVVPEFGADVTPITKPPPPTEVVVNGTVETGKLADVILKAVVPVTAIAVPDVGALVVVVDDDDVNDNDNDDDVVVVAAAVVAVAAGTGTVVVKVGLVVAVAAVGNTKISGFFVENQKNKKKKETTTTAKKTQLLQRHMSQKQLLPLHEDHTHATSTEQMVPSKKRFTFNFSFLFFSFFLFFFFSSFLCFTWISNSVDTVA